MKYIKASEENIDEIFDIVQNTVREIYPKYYPREVVDFFCELHGRENIAKDINYWCSSASEDCDMQGRKKGSAGILIADNKIVGTGSYEDNHITRVYVLPEFQGKGYGSFIMQCIENEISQKYSTVLLDASLPASRLYERRGYRTVRHERLSLENGVFLVYEVMEKSLCSVGQEA